MMDQTRCPGNFLLDVASIGLGAVSALTFLSNGYRMKRIANSISLSAGLLNEAGRDVNSNEALFKDNFEQRFSGALAKCKKEYDQIAAAVQKVHSWKKSETDEDAVAMPKTHWKKLAWGLGMTDKEFSEFEDEIDQSRKTAYMAQFVVQLVILQVNAQKRELSSYEQLSLYRVKKDMGDILELLHQLGVGNVMMFSLQEPTKPANTTQVAQAVDEVKLGDNTGSISSVTIRNPTEISVPIPLKKRNHKPGLVPPPPPGYVPTNPPPGFTCPAPFRYKGPDVYEMHRISLGPREKGLKQTTFRFLGMPFEINRRETNVFIACDKIPMSLDDIKAFLERNKDAATKQPIIETLLGVPAATSAAVYSYLSTKTDARTHQSHTWTVECIVPAPMGTEESKIRKMWSKKGQTATSHLVVYKGVYIVRPQPPRFPPVPVMRPPGRHSSISSRSHPKPAAKFELSQQEVENVINDYLASFSTLYDDVPVEQRGAALKAIVLPVEGDSDYESSSSWSGSSRSLVDD
ncbi:hypothetical protein VTL71DRAFT_10302 [Oculimacula yallundae]|uniref:Fungal N-terminal domain-containing protein n=1 Tax=Oculimacula yallundae TaxID=86028 RepID=A0ABR4CSL6_9HELO